MPQITEADFSQPDVVVSILEKGLHGGLIDKESLTTDEEDFCKRTEWIEEMSKFKCRCGSWHKTPVGEERCLRTQQPYKPTQVTPGYRVKQGTKLGLNLDIDYNLYLKENSSSVNTTALPYKSIIFAPDVQELTFSDRAGSAVFLPLKEVADFVDEDARNGIISNINKKRKRLVDWDALDDSGDDFEEIVYRLVSRDDDYFNESWGGSGPDQGKDGYCSINLGGRETRILVQAKFNNDGDSINGSKVESYCRKAQRHDCRGLIIGAVKTSGDLESEFETGAFHTRNVVYFRLWSGPVIKEKLSEHPELIAEYFLT